MFFICVEERDSTSLLLIRLMYSQLPKKFEYLIFFVETRVCKFAEPDYGLSDEWSRGLSIPQEDLE